MGPQRNPIVDELDDKENMYPEPLLYQENELPAVEEGSPLEETSRPMDSIMLLRDSEDASSLMEHDTDRSAATAVSVSPSFTGWRNLHWI